MLAVDSLTGSCASRCIYCIALSIKSRRCGRELAACKTLASKQAKNAFTRSASLRWARRDSRLLPAVRLARLADVVTSICENYPNFQHAQARRDRARGRRGAGDERRLAGRRDDRRLPKRQGEPRGWCPHPTAEPRDRAGERSDDGGREFLGALRQRQLLGAFDYEEFNISSEPTG